MRSGLSKSAENRPGSAGASAGERDQLVGDAPALKLNAALLEPFRSGGNPAMPGPDVGFCKPHETSRKQGNQAISGSDAGFTVHGDLAGGGENGDGARAVGSNLGSAGVLDGAVGKVTGAGLGSRLGSEAIAVPGEADNGGCRPLRDEGAKGEARPLGDQGRVKLSRAEQSRINGAKSRGPKTEAGKAASRRSAGLPATPEPIAYCCLAPNDDPAALEMFVHDLTCALRPVGSLQQSLAQRIAQIQWRLAQLPLLEQLLLQGSANHAGRSHWFHGLVLEVAGDLGQGMLTRVRQYERRLERSLGRCLQALQRLQRHALLPAERCGDGGAADSADAGDAAPENQ